MKVKSLGVVVLLLLCGCLAWSAPITGVTQTWTYNAETHKGTVHIVNVSRKNIVSYSIGEYVTYKDGHVDIAGERSQMNMYGDGVFAPGQTHDEEVNGPTMMEGADLTDPNNFRATVDVVIYEDDTAEVDNQQAFEFMLENLQAAVEAIKTLNQVVQKVLDDPSITDQHTAIVADLQRLAVVAKKEQHHTLGSYLDARVNEIPWNKTELPAFIKRNEQEIAKLEPHANLKVVQGVQP
jgi:hypothetical protein